VLVPIGTVKASLMEIMVTTGKHLKDPGIVILLMAQANATAKSVIHV
jgi:hypothetical protein